MNFRLPASSYVLASPQSFLKTSKYTGMHQEPMHVRMHWYSGLYRGVANL